MTIDIGNWTGGAPPTAFTSKSGTSGITISIGSGDITLGSIRDKINAASCRGHRRDHHRRFRRPPDAALDEHGRGKRISHLRQRDERRRQCRDRSVRAGLRRDGGFVSDDAQPECPQRPRGRQRHLGHVGVEHARRRHRRRVDQAQQGRPRARWRCRWLRTFPTSRRRSPSSCRPTTAWSTRSRRKPSTTRRPRRPASSSPTARP